MFFFERLAMFAPSDRPVVILSVRVILLRLPAETDGDVRGH
jgi:hypothetical protein